MSEMSTPLLETKGISKSFPGVKALKNVDLQLFRGEVLAVIGENGAGKSTLMKIIAGAYAQDEGSIYIEGVKMSFSGPVDARKAGISIIYQELNTIWSLTAAENIFLGRESSIFAGKKKEHKKTDELLKLLGVKIDPSVPCLALSVAEQQLIEIAKAISMEAKVIIMDEPTASIGQKDTKRLFDVIRDLKKRGISIIYISHRLEEIYQIADRIMIMRDGAHIRTAPAKEISKNSLIEAMVGRTMENEFPERMSIPGRSRLVVKGLTNGRNLKDISFNAAGGEILGIAGLVGSGRTDIFRSLFGADRMVKGSIELDGERIDIKGPRDAIKNGICMVSEHRKEEGLVLSLSVLANFALPNMDKFSSAGIVSDKKETNAIIRYINDLKIKTPSETTKVEDLSGGNQQKVILAKWLQKQFEVILFDEPTKGIDVGAKFEIYQLINRLAAENKVVIFISSELPEVLGLSDRILVMHEGKITGEITDVKNAKQEDIMKLAIA